MEDRIIYFDNAATSWPKPDVVKLAMVDFLDNAAANPGRSGHRLSVKAGRLLYDARESIAELLGIEDPLSIAFCLNVTQALNIGFRGVLKPGDEVVTTSMEHNSVARPLRYLEKCGVKLSIVQCASDGSVDPNDIKRAITSDTRMVVTTHASNVTGTLLPIDEIGRIARERGALYLVDAAQTVGCVPLDVKRLPVDMLAFTGHKSLMGPTGTGGLYVRSGLEVEPLFYGGTGSRSETDAQPEFLPDRLESGTMNTVGLVGLGAAARFILDKGIPAIRKHEIRLLDRLLTGLSTIQNIVIYGPKDPIKQVATVSFNIEGMEPSDVGLALDERNGIMCRVGLHCAPWAHRTLGTFPKGTVRLGMGYFNTEEEVDEVIKAIGEIAYARH
jgi:cysteine desulfurase family protein